MELEDFMKKIFLIGFVLLTLMSCTKNTENTGSESGETEKISINFYGWGENYNTALVEAFNASQDEIEVIFVEIPTGEYETKITTLLAGGVGDIDVYAQKRQSDMFPHYKNGFIEPLDTFIDNTSYDLNEISSSLKYLKVDGDIVALPFRSGAYFTFYNKKLFDEAGIPYPSVYVERGEWTWDKFTEVAKTLSDLGPETYGAILYTWGSIQTFPHMQALGEFIDSNGNLDILKEPLRTSVDVRKELEDYGAVIPLKELRVSKEHYSTLFYAGNAGMLNIGEWFPGFMIKGRDENLLQGFSWDDWGLTRLPSDTKEYVTSGAPTFAHVYSGSKKKDAAFTFLAWVSQADGGAKVMAQQGILPAAINEDVRNILAVSLPDTDSLNYFTEDRKVVPAIPISKYGSQIERTISETLDLYLYEGYTFDEYYAEVTKRLEEIIRTTK